MEVGAGTLETAQELERQAAMLCQEFHTWVFNYSDVIEALQAARNWMVTVPIAGEVDPEGYASLSEQLDAALQKAGMANGL